MDFVFHSLMQHATVFACFGSASRTKGQEMIDEKVSETKWPNFLRGDFWIDAFEFNSGEKLSKLKIHYITLGTPIRNAAGQITNAVLLLHNTSGASSNWLLPSVADELFNPSQPLDASRYFLIIPDSIGFGKSSKPSDGLRRRFPRYRYTDAVAAQYRLVTEELGIEHLRMVIGMSMGGMHAWVWAETHPTFMDAIVPIASQPSAMSGRNWIQRRVIIEAIRRDPEWNDGDYQQNPSGYIYVTPFTTLMTSSVVRLQELAPTREAADQFYERAVEQAKRRDANDWLYALESSMDYDPAPLLESIRARVLAINFADDPTNPPELGILEQAVRRIRDARYVIVPASERTVGHYTVLDAAIWKSHLADFISNLEMRA
jgi:homoserine O-acetyltransferase/O-succinyltransferase